MDVDNSDLDMIMCQFRTMNTNDKDYLISEFKRLSNTQLSTEGCCFYLDLAEWNLNSALWAYYEYEAAAAAAASGNTNNTTNQNLTNTTSSNSNNSSQNFSHSSSNSSINNFNELPEMQFLCDITIGEGESVAPNTNFLKTWRIKNTGNKRWPPGCQLKYVNGYNFSPATLTSTSSTNDLFSNDTQTPVAINLKELEPQEIADISISLKSPQQCGIYQCQYRTYTNLNQPFGDPIWLLLNVEEGGLLGCIQQLNNVDMFGNKMDDESNSRSRHLNGNTVNNCFNTSFNHNNINNNNYNNTNNQNGDVSHLNHQNHFHQYDSNKARMFRLDTNLNLVQNEASFNRTRTASAREDLNQSFIDEDEKRPDFYDDMFS